MADEPEAWRRRLNDVLTRSDPEPWYLRVARTSAAENEHAAPETSVAATASEPAVDTRWDGVTPMVVPAPQPSPEPAAADPVAPTPAAAIVDEKVEWAPVTPRVERDPGDSLPPPIAAVAGDDGDWAGNPPARRSGRLWWLVAAVLLLAVGVLALAQVDWIEAPPAVPPSARAPIDPVETAAVAVDDASPPAPPVTDVTVEDDPVMVETPAPDDPEPLPEPIPEPAVATVVAEPSFNCRRARSRVEMMICGSEPLAALDRQMAGLFYGIVAEADAATVEAVQRSRDDFLARRDRCPDAACVAEVYADRIDGLAQFGFAARPE